MQLEDQKQRITLCPRQKIRSRIDRVLNMCTQKIGNHTQEIGESSIGSSKNICVWINIFTATKHNIMWKISSQSSIHTTVILIDKRDPLGKKSESKFSKVIQDSTKETSTQMEKHDPSMERLIQCPIINGCKNRKKGIVKCKIL